MRHPIRHATTLESRKQEVLRDRPSLADSPCAVIWLQTCTTLYTDLQPIAPQEGTAVPLASVALPRMHRLLMVAAFCLLAQSTVLPLVSPAISVWTPVHQHITLNGVVPPHTHAYDTPGRHSASQPSCVVTDASGGTGGPHNESLVCAPAGDGTTASTAAVMHMGPGVGDVPAARLEALTPPVLQRDWRSVTVRPLIPPPRS
jgi:hypothetical protein